ncbi:long chain acyl-CoA synthetase 6, peroxisomal-like [Hibiscus syriacus]|uniref:long chain acyl-CoA synthetase 6, peroxisomal-like n=1 Tax=Hibiscus syriacus TaxID=106335 RepID=UPI0019208E82|nr:long chain acyl-CoA synthetase 6, peroxisomal-like [Hibiscus syriacus]
MTILYMLLSSLEITDISEQELELIEPLESKFPIDKIKVTVCCQSSFICFRFYVLSSRYKWMTYKEAATARTAIGCGLIHHGILKGSCIALYFINRPEWLIVDHACAVYSLISVPLYDTLGPDAVKYIINHADLKAVFCMPLTLNSLLSILSEIPSLRLIVVVGGMENEVPLLPSSTSVQVVTYSQLLSQGRSNLHPFCQPKPDDVATVCYTSGTTGTPKGVVLTHGNLIANASGFTISVKFNLSDVYISNLPLAHIFERFDHISLAHFGVAVGFYQGDTMKLIDDFADKETPSKGVFCKSNFKHVCRAEYI